MKNIFIMFCFLIACSSCNGKVTSENNEEVQSMSLDEQTRIMHEKIDSLNREIVELRGTVNSIVESVKEENKKIAERSMGEMVITVLFVVIIVIIIVATIRYYKKLNSRIKALREKIDAMESIENNKKPQPQSINRRTSRESSEISEIKKRVDKLEEQFSQLPKATVNVPETTVGKKEEEDIKDGYFEYPIGPSNGKYYFLELHNSNSDKSIFKVKIKNDGGEFEPCNFSCIKSYNYAPEVLLNWDSKVTVADSTGFKVIEPGRVRKDGDKWIIVKPVKVRFK